MKKDLNINNHEHECECNPIHPLNCELVLQSFHQSVFEALRCFGEGAQFEADALREAIEACEALLKSLSSDEIGERVFKEAEYILDHSGCEYICSKNSCLCKSKEEKLNHYFSASHELKHQALYLLEEAIEKLRESIIAQEKGKEAAESYVDCVHHRKDCKH